jgi:hypothetical protein
MSRITILARFEYEYECRPPRRTEYEYEKRTNQVVHRSRCRHR